MAPRQSGFKNETSEDVTMQEMRGLLADEVKKSGGIRPFCRQKGIESHSALVQTLDGKRDVSEGLANSLGYLKITKFRKMGGPDGS